MIKFKQFIQTLFENYHTTFNSFAKEFPDKEKEIATSINHFRKLQNTLQGDEKNIDWWAKQGWEKFNTFVQQNISKKTKSSLKKEQGDFYVLQDDSEWTILIPLDHQASCYHGAGTDWCISKQKHDYFYRYIFEDNKLLVFCIRKSDKNMWAILYNIKNNHQTEEKKIFNFDSAYKKDDSAINAETFKTETGLNLDTINEWLTKKQDEILDRLAANRTKDYNYLYMDALRTHQKNSELENLMIAKKDSKKISEYTHTVLRNRWPEGEKIIIDEANKYFNALDNMSGNITFNMYFYEYKNIIKNDLPQEIKTKLLKFPSFCYMFANQYTEGSFPEGEPTISKDANLSYTYAINVIHKRFPAGEPIIAQNPNIALNYALYVIKGRFPKGEPAISTNSVTSFYYALNIINGRFPEGELAIKKTRTCASSYFYNFINEKGDDNDFEAWLKNKNQK